MGGNKGGRDQKGQVDLDLDLWSTLIQGRDLKVVPPPTTTTTTTTTTTKTTLTVL